MKNIITLLLALSTFAFASDTFVGYILQVAIIPTIVIFGILMVIASVPDEKKIEPKVETPKPTVKKKTVFDVESLIELDAYLREKFPAKEEVTKIPTRQLGKSRRPSNFKSNIKPINNDQDQYPHNPRLNYQAFLASNFWAKRRIQAFQAHGDVCECCGSDKYIQVHHVNYDNVQTSPVGDLLVVCGACHAKIHTKMGKEPKSTREETLELMS